MMWLQSLAKDSDAELTKNIERVMRTMVENSKINADPSFTDTHPFCMRHRERLASKTKGKRKLTKTSEQDEQAATQEGESE